jgi:hypothetical protein
MFAVHKIVKYFIVASYADRSHLLYLGQGSSKNYS